MVNMWTARRAETESHAMVLVRDVPSGSVPCQCFPVWRQFVAVRERLPPRA